MIAYVLLLVLNIVTALAWLLDRRNRSAYFWLFSATLILFSGLRYNVGTDYESYEALYDYVLSDWASSDVGYVFIIQLMDKIGLGFDGVIFLVSLLTISFAAIAIKKFNCGIHGLFIYFSVPLFYLLSLNTIRQTLAAAIFMLATRYARNADPLRFFLLVILAGSFHITAILLAPAYFMVNRKPTYWILAACLVGGVIFALNIPAAAELLGFHPVYLEEKQGSALAQFIINLSAAVFFIHNRRRMNGLRIPQAPLVNYLSVSTGICFASLFSTVGSEFILRMTTYFTWTIVILIPSYISSLRSWENRRNGFLGMYVLCAMYFLVTASKGAAIDLLPYRTIFERNQYGALIAPDRRGESKERG